MCLILDWYMMKTERAMMDALEEHQPRSGFYGSDENEVWLDWACDCGEIPSVEHDTQDAHRQHVAAMLVNIAVESPEIEAHHLRSAAIRYPAFLRDMVSRGSVFEWLLSEANERDPRGASSHA